MAKAKQNARKSPSTVLTSVKTQLDAVAFLQNAGFKISKTSFSRDLKEGKIATNAQGRFEKTALLAYAGASREPVAVEKNNALGDAATQRYSADAELKKYQAERTRLKLEKEQGLLMSRAQHERDLAARALFFKNEVRTFIRLHGHAIISLVGGDAARAASLTHWWDEATADWLHAWSQERTFAVDSSDTNADGDEDE